MVQGQLVRQIEYLKVENQILRKKTNKRVIVTPSERHRLIKFGLLLNGDIRRFISIVSYSTFRRWVRDESSKKPKTKHKRGRPKTSHEIRQLVLRLARENNWGYTRILGELKKLEIYSLSRNTIKNILNICK